MGAFILFLIIGLAFFGYGYYKTAGEETAEGAGCGIALAVVMAIIAYFLFSIGK